MTFMPYSAVGTITLLPNSGFQLREWIFSNGSLQSVNATGTFTTGTNCTISLAFNAGASSATGGPFRAPTTFRGILTGEGVGVVAVQPDATSTFTGEFIGQ